MLWQNYGENKERYHEAAVCLAMPHTNIDKET